MALAEGTVKWFSEKKGFGFDAQKMEWLDLFKEGIIDPAKVTRSALQNAASIAGLLLTTECTVTEKPEEEKPKPVIEPKPRPEEKPAPKMAVFEPIPTDRLSTGIRRKRGRFRRDRIANRRS